MAYIYNLQDVFPDSLVSAGLASKESIIWKIGRKLENYTYETADTIIVISEDIKQNIIKKGVPENKIEVIPNWVDTNSIKHINKEKNSLYKKFNLKEDTFKVVYAGNLGKMQGIEILIEAAIRLKNDKEIEMIIFGNGSEEDTLLKRIKKENLNNIKIYPLQEPNKVSEVYSLGDLCVVSCKKGLGKGAFPSKTVSIMSTQTPVLAVFDSNSELCNIIKKYDAGVCVDPENVEELVETINKMKANKALLESKGINARKVVEEKFSKKVCLRKYIEVFEKNNIENM